MTQYQDSKKQLVKTNTVKHSMSVNDCNYTDNYYGDCVCLTAQLKPAEKKKRA